MSETDPYLPERLAKRTFFQFQKMKKKNSESLKTVMFDAIHTFDRTTDEK